MINYLCVIQARLGSTRFPGKVMETVEGIPLVKRVWNAAKTSNVDKVIVAWPERYPDLDQNDVRERFRRISKEFPSKHIVRLTADCPLLRAFHINEAIEVYERAQANYYCNRDRYPDGYDVQVFKTFMVHADYATHKEHVILPDIYTTPNKHMSVDTREDLERVRRYAR